MNNTFPVNGACYLDWHPNEVINDNGAKLHAFSQTGKKKPLILPGNAA